MKRIFLILFVCFNAYCETQVFVGMAKYEGQLAYIERHTVVYDQGTIIKSMTEYLNPEGMSIGSLQSVFTHSLTAPDYVFRDKRNNILQGLQWKGGQTEMFSQDNDKRKIVKKFLTPSTSTMISGEGLKYYIAENLDQLIARSGEEFQYVVPGKLDAYTFFIQPVAHNSEQAEFEVHMKSWFLRLFSPRLKLIFDRRLKRLKSYEGLSNLRREDGKMMSVDIQYVYEN